MKTCRFSYVRLLTNLPCDAFGIERTWDYLKEEFNRQGDGLPDAEYFETIGPGPQLFAVIGDKVFYHDDNKWSQYSSATNVIHGTMEVDD